MEYKCECFECNQKRKTVEDTMEMLTDLCSFFGSNANIETLKSTIDVETLSSHLINLNWTKRN